MSSPQIAPSEVCKAWIETVSPKLNEEKDSGISFIENCVDLN